MSLKGNAHKKIVSNNKIDNKSIFPIELNTMPGWAGSSWYFLRYLDPKNSKQIFSKEALDYWSNVDLYIGGSEHATGHLLYSRFWTKLKSQSKIFPSQRMDIALRHMRLSKVLELKFSRNSCSYPFSLPKRWRALLNLWIG